MATPLPTNRAPFSLTEVLGCTGGRVHGPLADEAMQIDGLSTDTRTLVPGQAFVALSGERFDGHHHLATAAAGGAALAIVERDVPAPTGLTLLRVESTVAALAALAHHHLTSWRDHTGGAVLALTGSAGKTTTKWAIASLLETIAPRQVFATPGNLNNQIGVPLSVLCLGPEHRYAVLELGTNCPGEIAALGRIVRPDVALLTLVATAHTEGLGDIDAVAEEKGSLFAHLARHEGATAIGNGDDPRVKALVAHCEAPKKVLYGDGPDHDYCIAERKLVSHDQLDLTLKRPDGSAVQMRVPVIGQAGALASAAALAAVEALAHEPCRTNEIPYAASEGALDGRLRSEQLPGGLIVIDDSYNSNPASGHASLLAASEVRALHGGRLLLVLGEMRELGKVSGAAHAILGQQAAAQGADLVVAVSGDARHTADAAAALGVDARFVDDAESAAQTVLDLVRDGDVVLVKGSRSIRTERVAEALRSRRASAGGGPSTEAKCAGRAG